MVDLASDATLTFGQLLKTLRRRARLTQRDLGIALGYSETYITRLEGGSRAPDVGMVRASFVEALGLGREPALARRLIELAEAARICVPEEPPAQPPRGTTLPAQLTTFIGRMRELAEINRLIRARRLVTLTGAGGLGKTRLAIEAMGAGGGPFADGVFLAELAPLSDAALVPQLIADVLKLPKQAAGNTIAALCAYIADKHLLLILDNCEHLIGACAALADALLRACPQLHILATSREALNIAGELAWRVPSLSDLESSQLFADRAAMVRPDFALSDRNAGLIASIGQHLDGIPLAIELAASRLAGLSVEQLAARLGDRFRLLTSGNRAALPRHQTLRALIDWSHGLLP